MAEGGKGGVGGEETEGVVTWRGSGDVAVGGGESRGDGGRERD